MITFESSRLGRIIVPDRVPGGAALFYTTRDFAGFLDDASTSALRELIRERFSIDAKFSTCNQVHGANAVSVSESEDAWCEFDSCDALWSAEKGNALGIKVADCLPVTLVDSRHSVIANIHAGWRGAAQKIVSKTIDTLRAATPFDAHGSLAYLGPSIRVCCFEVGEEVISAFEQTHGDISLFVDRTRGSKPHVDLAALTLSMLVEHGFESGDVIDTKLCTRCDERLHSYRRDRPLSGRNLAIVAQ